MGSTIPVATGESLASFMPTSIMCSLVLSTMLEGLHFALP